MISATTVADLSSALVESFGRLHPIVVHIPLGLVVAAFLVEALRAIQRRPTLSAFTPVALAIAALGAVAASGTGWFFAESEGSGDSLFWHRWLGIAAAVLLVAITWMASRAVRPGMAEGSQVTPVLRGGLLVLTLVIGWVGHLGGDMVWGENYVLEPVLKAMGGSSDKDSVANSSERSVVKGGTAESGAQVLATDARESNQSIDAMTFYAVKVLPVFQDRCYECHGNGKHKGGLSLDDRTKVVTRDSDGVWIVSPGDPGNSLLMTRCLLPADNDESMPPKGDRLTATQLEVLRQWITDGAVMPVSADRGAPVVASNDGRDRLRTPGAGSARAQGLPALSDGQIQEGQSLRSRGINAVPVSVGAAGFAVSIPGGKEVGDTDIAAIIPIAPQIEELSFARAGVTDAGMMQMPAMPLARTVRLDNTSLTDIGIIGVLSRTLNAETVNLVNTGASDGVFVMLAKLPKLQRVYVFETQITQEGINQFRASHPGVEIVSGSSTGSSAGSAPAPATP